MIRSIRKFFERLLGPQRVQFVFDRAPREVILPFGGKLRIAEAIESQAGYIVQIGEHVYILKEGGKVLGHDRESETKVWYPHSGFTTQEICALGLDRILP